MVTNIVYDKKEKLIKEFIYAQRFQCQYQNKSDGQAQNFHGGAHGVATHVGLGNMDQKASLNIFRRSLNISLYF